VKQSGTCYPDLTGGASRAAGPREFSTLTPAAIRIGLHTSPIFCLSCRRPRHSADSLCSRIGARQCRVLAAARHARQQRQPHYNSQQDRRLGTGAPRPRGAYRRAYRQSAGLRRLCARGRLVRDRAIEDMVESASSCQGAAPKGRQHRVVTIRGAEASPNEAARLWASLYPDLSRPRRRRLVAAVPDPDISTNPLDTQGAAHPAGPRPVSRTVARMHDDPLSTRPCGGRVPRGRRIDRKLKNFAALETIIRTQATKPIVCLSP